VITAYFLRFVSQKADLNPLNLRIIIF